MKIEVWQKLNGGLRGAAQRACTIPQQQHHHHRAAPWVKPVLSSWKLWQQGFCTVGRRCKLTSLQPAAPLGGKCLLPLQEEVPWVWSGAELAAMALSQPLPCLKSHRNFAWERAGRQEVDYFPGKNGAGKRMKQDKPTSWFFGEVLSALCGAQGGTVIQPPSLSSAVE